MDNDQIDARLQYELAQAKAGLERIAAQNHRSWEAGAANVSLIVIAKLEAIIASIKDAA